MNLDEAAIELRRFRDALADFMEVLGVVGAQRAQVEERLLGSWDDEFAQEFARRHGEYARPIAQFAEHLGPGYLAFIDDKVDAIGRYLHG